MFTYPISLKYSIDQAAAKALAKTYGLTIADDPVKPFLAFNEMGLSLYLDVAKNEMVFCPTLDPVTFLTKQEEGKTLLIKALGKRQAGDKILDATAGLLRDALTIRLQGYEVIALERSALLFLLLEDAIARAKENPVLRAPLSHLFQLHHQEAQNFFTNSTQMKEISVIYLDPMFEESKKSAAVKAPMQALRAILGAEEAPEILLEAALQTTVRRIVIKRHKNAPLLKANPSQQLIGKSIRFDVYQR